MKHPLPILVAALACLLTAQAADWPNWRGPSFNGTSPEKGLPAEWEESDIKWETPLPSFSGATPAISSDSVFVSSPDKNKNLLLLCLDRKDGKVRWEKQIATGDVDKGRGNMASPSPVTDGKIVYALFGTGDLVALDFDGKILWQRNLGADYGKFAIMWIYGSSPLLYDGKLYVQVLQRTPAPADYPGMAGSAGDRESYLLALDPATGKTLWKHVRPTNARMESMESYASPVPLEAGDRKQILLVGGDCLTGHDPATGKEIWRGYGINRKGGEWMRVVASPVDAGGIAIACGPKKEPTVAFRTDLKGDITEKGLAWSQDEKATPDVCTPAFDDGKLFLLDGDKQFLACLEAKTGRKIWEGKLGHRETIRSSPTVADGKIYTISEQGTVVVCDANGSEFKILSTQTFKNAEPTRSSPVVASGDLIFRLGDRIVCIGK
ncbi:MAG: PQQ-binding-like beta-propeller repeat protein [Chthoniobacteraceae bacterium]